ncbi:hypothetical protein CRYUN_Cryun01aG0259100 [Craigia yunnanensis]
MAEEKEKLLNGDGGGAGAGTGILEPQHYLSGNFPPAPNETPPINDLPVKGHLPECLNGKFVRVGPNPKFAPVAAYNCSETLKGYLDCSWSIQKLREKAEVFDLSHGNGTANTALIYHHGKLLALRRQINLANVPKVLEDGDLQTLGMLDYDKRLAHSFTPHPKVDPVSDETRHLKMKSEIVKEKKLIYSFDASKKARFGIVKFDLHAEPEAGKLNIEVGGNVQGLFDFGPGRFGSEAIFVPHEPGTTSEEDDGYLIFFVHDENTGKSSVNVIDAKTMSPDPVAVVELPRTTEFLTGSMLSL